MSYLKKVNYSLLILPILIFSLGFITLLSISPEKAKVQLLIFVFSYALYLLLARLDTVVYKLLWKYGYAFSVLLLAATYFFGRIHFGASRWVNLGFITFQPSEIAKVILLIALATFISSNLQKINSLSVLARVLCMSLIPTILVLVQPDLGTSLVLMALTMGLLFFAGVDKHIFLFGFLGLAGLSKPVWAILHDYQKERILVFLNPQLDVLGRGYNVFQAIIAIGSGGFFGKGFLQGTQTHLNYLPSHLTDFIFASFAEEWGFIGVAAFMFLYVLLLLIILRIAHRTKDVYKSFLVAGVFIIFFTQFVINVGMNLGVMPVTGIPLPFVSYGGTSLVVSLILLSLVQSVCVN